MKVRINGYDIECTPEEFIELTRAIGKEKITQEPDGIPEINLPKDYRDWLKPNGPVTAYGCDQDYDRWFKHPDIVALYGCQITEQPSEIPVTPTYTGDTALTQKFWDDIHREKVEEFKKRRSKRHEDFLKRQSELTERERSKDFPPYLDTPKPDKE